MNAILWEVAYMVAAGWISLTPVQEEHYEPKGLDARIAWRIRQEQQAYFRAKETEPELDYREFVKDFRKEMRQQRREERRSR